MHRSIIAFAVVFFVSLFTSLAFASVHEARIPLRDHKLREADLTAALFTRMHLPAVGVGSITVDLSGLNGSDFVEALNAALGDGGHVALETAVDGERASSRDVEQLVLRVDPEKLPRSVDAIKQAIRTFTVVAAPGATANQRRTYGLSMPVHVDPHVPMVVLVHGLDCNRSNWYAIADLLSASGYQVAYFCYPSDGPIEESAAMFAQHMAAVHENYPDMPLDIVGHSMGGLVARRYVEGADYAGGVRHLILLGTPNLGTRWAAYRIVLGWQEHFQLWRHDPDWSPTWMITDGLGEAGRDLRPTSAFLTELNSHPRRAGVAYTIVAGDQHPVGPMTAAALNGVANAVPNRITGWWGVRQTESFLHREADSLNHRAFQSDGPVSVASTKLDGVDDYVLLNVDHNALYLPYDGKPPAAWDVIRDRLAR